MCPTSNCLTISFEFWGWNAIGEPVQPATPLPVTPRCNYVTAFHAPFFKKRNKKQLFNLSEWEFFFEDLIRNHMAEHGKIYFLPDDVKWDGLRISIRSSPALYKAMVAKWTDAMSFLTTSQSVRRLGCCRPNVLAAAV